jgi:hypothetical protein
MSVRRRLMKLESRWPDASKAKVPPGPGACCCLIMRVLKPNMEVPPGPRVCPTCGGTTVLRIMRPDVMRDIREPESAAS